jgi:hypothetical protein
VVHCADWYTAPISALQPTTQPSWLLRLRIVEFTLDHEAPYFSNMRRRNSRKDSDLTGVVDARYTGGASLLLMLELGECWRANSHPVFIITLCSSSPCVHHHPVFIITLCSSSPCVHHQDLMVCFCSAVLYRVRATGNMASDLTQKFAPCSVVLLMASIC